MAANSNNLQQNIGSSSPFGNSSGFPGQFQLPAAQAQAIAQAHAQAKAQAVHAQFQAQLQTQGFSFNPSHSGGTPNFSSPSPAISGSGNVGPKRFLQKPLAPMKTMEASASFRKKQKLPEKRLHERVAGILPESALYTQLLEFESRVDAVLTRKKADIQEADSARALAPHEGFEVKRKGEQEFTASIRLEMNYMPERYKLPPPLVELLGIEVDTRARIIVAIWHYIKVRKLQCLDDPSSFNCDPPLQNIFGEEKIKFTAVTQRISSHLFPPQLIHLEHRIKLLGNNPVGNACYDVLVDVPLPIQRELSVLLANTDKTKEIEACDEAICSSIKKIHKHQRRRAFYLSFSQSSIEFTNELIDSQSKDLKIFAGEASRDAEKENHSDFYNQPWVEDAVIRYLNRKPSANAPSRT